MTWDDYFQQCQEAEAAGNRSRVHEILEAARKLVADRVRVKKSRSKRG